MDYQPGDRLRLKTHIGHRSEGVHTVPAHEDAAYEAFMQRYAPLFTDQIGTVVEVTSAGVAGVGGDDEEHVALRFDHHDPDTGIRVAGREGSRIVSFTEQQIQEWFEAVPAVGVVQGGQQ